MYIIIYIIYYFSISFFLYVTILYVIILRGEYCDINRKDQTHQLNIYLLDNFLYILILYDIS